MAASRPRTSSQGYWIAAALSALALASPLAIAAAPTAAGIGIQFVSAGGDGSGDLTITVESDTQMTDWTISLSNGTSTYTLDDFADFTDSTPFTADQPQTYVLNASAAQQDLETKITLPPGNYTATATAGTDAGNDPFASPQTMAGTFSFLAQPKPVLSSPSFNTSQPNQTVSIAGQISGCALLACPSSWSGTPVTITDVTAAGKPQWTGTLDSAGNFSIAGVTGVPGDSYSASVTAVQGTSLAATAPSNTLDVPQYALTSITATATPSPYGTQSITGQLTYQPQSGFNQDAPAGVAITATGGPHKVSISTTTGPGGNFRLTLPGITGTTTWLLSTQSDLTTTPFLAGTQNSVGATQLWPARITGFTASIDKFGYVTVAGCMSTTISPPPPPEYPEVQIQWRALRSGPWHELGTLGTMHRQGCAGVGFLGKGPAQAASAYYRAYFPPGDSTYASAASASTARVWIYPTRFNPFRASSRSVLAGRRVTIGGTLQYEGGKWRGYGRQRIVIIFSRNGKNNWFKLPGGVVKTNSKGKFSVTFRDTYGSEYWSANFAGNKTHLVVSAPLIRIKVHGKLRSRPASPGQPPVGRLSAALSTAGTGGRLWPFVLTADPLLMLMGDN